MKRVLLILTALFMAAQSLSLAQERFNLPISSIVADENMPREARQALEAKLKSMLTRNGFYASDGVWRFVFTAKVTVDTKDILPTNPPRISTKMDVTFFVGDAIDNRIYESCTVTAKGIGTNENKSLIATFQSISVQNAEIAAMFASARQSISEYYKVNYKSVLKKAEALSANKEYDAAIYELESVPEIDTAIVSACQNAILSVYQRKIDDESAVLLRKAKSEWMVDKSVEAGKMAAEYIAGVNPASSSAEEADLLLQEIDKKLRRDEASAAARAREEKEYQRKTREEAVTYTRNMEQQRFEFEKEKHKDEQAYRSNALAACKEIGLAYAKSLSQTSTNKLSNNGK